MKSMVEEILGYQVEQTQLEEAINYTKIKMNFQKDLLGVDNAVSEQYVAKVVSEVYESQSFSSFTNKLSQGVMACNLIA